MKPYDAKHKQSCLICNFEISHNKQGRFTSHLKNNHHLTLEQYLITYFYRTEDLICSYELCNKQVGLRRGKSNKFCSKACGSKGSPLICVNCGKRFDGKHRQTKSCSTICEKKIRSLRTTEWHKGMDKELKIIHFKRIISKTSATRKKNKTPSWNSGKKGIYSDETIDKIRKATLKQMENQVFRKSSIERKMETYLIEQNIPYIYSFILKKRQFDFLLTEANIIIECDGDYWHANPKFFSKPSDWQIDRIRIDQVKNLIAESNGYHILRFWEDDIINNFEEIKSIIYDLLATT